MWQPIHELVESDYEYLLRRYTKMYSIHGDLSKLINMFRILASREEVSKALAVTCSHGLLSLNAELYYNIDHLKCSYSRIQTTLDEGSISLSYCSGGESKSQSASKIFTGLSDIEAADIITNMLPEILSDTEHWANIREKNGFDPGFRYVK